MLERLWGLAKLGAKLLLVEMFLPGGTLLVLAVLLVRRRSASLGPGRLVESLSFPGQRWRAVWSDLVARPRRPA